MTALAKHQERAGEVSAPLSSADSYLSMIERAARDPEVNIDKMRQLVELRNEELVRIASVAFDEAYAEMQPLLPAIVKRGASNNGAYAKWEDIQDKVNPVIHAHGFGLMFKTDTSGDRVKVTAILRHRQGHKESTDYELKPDKSGNKQDVHAVASATSYAKRYAASALLNIRTIGEDDDGNAAAGQPEIVFATDEQLAEIRTLMKATKTDEAKFAAYMKEERLDAMTTQKAEQAILALKAKQAAGVGQ